MLNLPSRRKKKTPLIYSTFLMLSLLPSLMSAQQKTTPDWVGNRGKNITKSAVTILSPRPGEKVLGDLKISLNLSAQTNPSTLRLLLNGEDITGLFSGQLGSSMGCEGCMESITIHRGSGLRNGKNTLTVSAKEKEAGEESHFQKVRFDWAPEGLVGEPVNTYTPPPAVTFITSNPGGGSPWIQVGANQYPDSTDTPCSSIFQVIVLDRSQLTKKDYQCFSDTAALKTYLGSRTTDDLVIAGTTASNYAGGGLDTTPIGGTDYSDGQKFPSGKHPNGYMIIGSGQAGPNQATESYWVDGSAQAPYQYAPFMNGLLTEDQNGYYNFHTSEYRPFVISPNDKVQGNSAITIGNQLYTAPSSSDGSGGVWVLTLDRVLLQPVDSSSDAGAKCVYSAQENLGTCGKIYSTGSSSNQTGTDAMNSLAADLANVDPRNFTILTTVGNPLGVANLTPAFAQALTNLGGSPYTFAKLKDVSAGTPTFSLLTSSDPAFAKTLLTKNAFSSSVFSDQKQTGYLRGLLGKGLTSLFEPVAYAQETADNVAEGKSVNYEFQQIAWALGGDWPMMDTSGRVNAYKALSTVLIQTYLENPSGDHLDDIRYFYTGSQNQTIANGHPDPTGLPYPGDGNGYTAQDWADAAGQVTAELRYLRQTLAFFGKDQMGKVVASSESSVASSIIGAAADVQKAPYSLSLNNKVGMNMTSVMNLSASVISFVPDAGLVAGILRTISTASGGFHKPPNAIASADLTIFDFIGNMVSDTESYRQDIENSYYTILDNIYSDWGRLSAAGKKVAETDGNGWYLPTEISLSSIQNSVRDGAQRSFYLQLISQQYAFDLWKNQPVSKATDIGSWELQQSTCTFLGCDSLCRSVYRDVSLDSGLSFSNLSIGQTNQYDVQILGGTLTNNLSGNVKEVFPPGQLLETLTGTLKIPTDLLASSAGPVPHRAGAAFSTDACYGSDIGRIEKRK